MQLSISFSLCPSCHSTKSNGRQQQEQEQEQEQLDPNKKITADLNTVLDKVRLCREMLPEAVQARAAGGGGRGEDDLLLEVVGFLEACQGRMLELIEAGMSEGAEGGMTLSEEVFEQCLRVNDALARTLEAEKVSYGP